LIAEPYSAARPAGKARCKAALQAELGFKDRPKTPLFLYAGALEDTAGAQRVLDALPALLKTAAHVLLLAPRAGDLATRAAHLAREHEDRLVLLVEDDEALLRRALAGADVLLVPAAGAPAIAWRGLRYGVVPVAPAGSEVPALLTPRPTPRGASAADKDAVAPAFYFRSPTGAALGRAALKASEAFRVPVLWRRLRRAAMTVPAIGDETSGPQRQPATVEALHRPVSPVLTLAETAHQSLAAPAAGEPASAPYIDWGPAPPERYGEDALELLVQSPRRLFGYWELAPETWRGAQAAGGPSLVLHVDREERVLSARVGDLGEWWLDGEPGHAYRLELRAPDGRALLESARVRTPREAESERDEVRFSRPRATAKKSPAPRRAAKRSSSAARASAAESHRQAAPLGRATAASGREEGRRPGTAARRGASEPEPASRRAPSSHERPRSAGAAGDEPFGSSEHGPRRRH
jgi:hypothetical protein